MTGVGWGFNYNRIKSLFEYNDEIYLRIHWFHVLNIVNAKIRLYWYINLAEKDTILTSKSVHYLQLINVAFDDHVHVAAQGGW